jgi:hypothetical protein
MDEQERRALVRTTIVEAGNQIGWFNPASKRFCYTDEREHRPERMREYSVPVYAIPLPGGGA